MGVGGGGRVLPPSLPAPLRESIKLDCLQFSEPSGAGEPTGRVPGALAPELQHWANSTLATLKHHHLAPPPPLPPLGWHCLSLGPLFICKSTRQGGSADCLVRAFPGAGRGWRHSPHSRRGLAGEPGGPAQAPNCSHPSINSPRGTRQQPCSPESSPQAPYSAPLFPRAPQGSPKPNLLPRLLRPEPQFPPDWGH